MAVYQGQEPAIVNANFFVDARVELVVQCHHKLAFGNAILRQVAGPSGKNYVAKVIAARITGRLSDRPFRYMHLGELATIGRRAAVVEFGHLRGFTGWLFWSVVHIYFLIGLRNRFIVAFTWLWSYLTFQRGARLITEPERIHKNKS